MLVCLHRQTLRVSRAQGGGNFMGIERNLQAKGLHPATPRGRYPSRDHRSSPRSSRQVKCYPEPNLKLGFFLLPCSSLANLSGTAEQCRGAKANRPFGEAELPCSPLRRPAPGPPRRFAPRAAPPAPLAAVGESRVTRRLPAPPRGPCPGAALRLRGAIAGNSQRPALRGGNQLGPRRRPGAVGRPTS